ncbi:hypothetical protein CFC21_091809 [Triticum aestivum]|uniref:Uncharacterized protein n=2 Tax=Triticum aestivum TaxID=4565 RepID=A0A9R1MTE9_WHEAT|nr:hypothetical protein CFC21_091809 [Triticum aestivum]
MTRTDRRNAGSAPIPTPGRSPPAISASSSSTPPPPGPRETVPPPPVPPLCPRSRRPPTLPPTPTPAPDPTFFDDVVDVVADKYGWDLDAEVRVWPIDAERSLVGAVQRYELRARAGGAAVALARASDGAVDWSRPDAPVVEEVVGLDGVEFVAGDDTLGFGSGIRDLAMVGPFELVVCDGAGRGLAELQLPSVRTPPPESLIAEPKQSQSSLCLQAGERKGIGEAGTKPNQSFRMTSFWSQIDMRPILPKSAPPVHSIIPTALQRGLQGRRSPSEHHRCPVSSVLEHHWVEEGEAILWPRSSRRRHNKCFITLVEVTYTALHVNQASFCW